MILGLNWLKRLAALGTVLVGVGISDSVRSILSELANSLKLIRFFSGLVVNLSLVSWDALRSQRLQMENKHARRRTIHLLTGVAVLASLLLAVVQLKANLSALPLERLELLGYLLSNCCNNIIKLRNEINR